MHTKLAVLGGGPGGYAAAFLAADLGIDVTIVDDRATLGGTCLFEGCIPSKMLLHVATAMEEARAVGRMGRALQSSHDRHPADANAEIRRDRGAWRRGSRNWPSGATSASSPRAVCFPIRARCRLNSARRRTAR